jgi:hypothetical protein
MTDDDPQSAYSDVVWAPFYQHGKLQYWVEVGRSQTKIGSDGKPRTEFYFDRHAAGGSTWGRMLPPGEKPAAPKPQAKRPGQSADDEEEEEEV